MKLEATAKEIRALLEVAEADLHGDPAASEAGHRARQAVARRVPRQLFDRYQSLVDVGRMPAVVAIERGVCSGCHVRLPTMVEHRARRSPAIHTCPHCRRMLYVPELVHGHAAAAAEEASRHTTPAHSTRRS